MGDEMDRPTNQTSDGEQLVRRIRESLAGQSAQERAAQNREAALRWLFLWHKSTPGLLRRAVRVGRPGYAAQLERAGLIGIYKTPAVRGGRVVMLTEDGLALAEAMFPEFIGRYDTRWASVKARLLVHDLMTQVLVLEAMAKREVAEFWPEHVAGAADVNGGKRSDCRILFVGSALPTAVEIERNAKSGYELDRSLMGAARAVHRNEVSGHVYTFLHQATADHYRKTLASPLPYWERQLPANRWVRTGEHWSVPLEIQARFKFIVRRDLMTSILP
ncbi:MAG: hypothetical protein U1F41_13575 [Burkholderiales bacterium]